MREKSLLRREICVLQRALHLVVFLGEDDCNVKGEEEKEAVFWREKMYFERRRPVF